jgi:hypothetical protein
MALTVELSGCRWNTSPNAAMTASFVARQSSPAAKPLTA